MWSGWTRLPALELVLGLALDVQLLSLDLVVAEELAAVVFVEEGLADCRCLGLAPVLLGAFSVVGDRLLRSLGWPGSVVVASSPAVVAAVSKSSGVVGL